MEFNYHFITVILKSQNSVSSNTVKTVLEAALLKSGNKKALHLISYLKQNGQKMMRSRTKIVRFRAEIMLFRT